MPALVRALLDGGADLDADDDARPVLLGGGETQTGRRVAVNEPMADLLGDRLDLHVHRVSSGSELRR